MSRAAADAIRQERMRFDVSCRHSPFVLASPVSVAAVAAQTRRIHSRVTRRPGSTGAAWKGNIVKTLLKRKTSPSGSAPERSGRRPAPRRGWLPLLAGAALAAGSSGAQATPPAGAVLTLSDALRATAAQSEAAVAAALDVSAAKEQTAKAKAAYWPVLSVSGDWQGRDHEIVAIFGTFEVPTTQKNFFTAEANVTELLWDGGRRPAALAVARGSEAAAALKGKSDVQTAQLQSLGAYLKILLLKAQRRVVDQRIASLEEHLRLARDLYEEGVVARNDVLGTEVRLRVVKDQIAEIGDGIAVATQTLSRLMGLAAGEVPTLPEALPSPPPLPDGVEGLRRRAAESNPRLESLRANLRVDESRVTAKRGETWPSLFAQLSHTYQQNEYLAYPNANVFYVGLSWQVWENGARKAAVRQAEIAARKTGTEIAELTRSLDVEVDRVYREFTQALRQAETARMNVEAAEESLRIEEDQYKAGLTRTTDVLDAESTLAESRFSLVNQHYTAYLKEGLLAAHAGLDLPAVFAGVAGEGR
jgi:outer membrane protein